MARKPTAAKERGRTKPEPDAESDFLVLGSGIAGLSAALRLAGLGRVHLLTKKNTLESNTNYAQGGIAAVMGEGDSFESHVQDTLSAGAGLCDETLVRGVVREGPERIRELMASGVRFSGARRAPDLGLEGGHSKRRILHAGDRTGREIERALARRVRRHPRIRIFENHIGVELLLAEPAGEARPERNRCWGAWALDSALGDVRAFRAKATVLATGGAGKVYLYTSNPDIATGDGMAMAYRAGCTLANLEFVQFHPTCLYHPGPARPGGERSPEGHRFLLSEALRGEGGRLLRKDGTPLMEGAHPLKDLAPRDVVARAIDADMKRSGAECVFLDMTALKSSFLKRRFPHIHAHCLALGLDMAKDPLPVVPAAHFFCGGVQTGPDAATELPGLFAIGEVAHTGLHGANRLASNSLLEGCVFASRACRRLGELWPGLKRLRVPAPSPFKGGREPWTREGVVIRQDWDEVRRLMWNYAGIVRSDAHLLSALERLRVIRREIAEGLSRFRPSRDLIELGNIALLGELICVSAFARDESRGLHYSADHPQTLESRRADTRVSLGGPCRRPDDSLLPKEFLVWT